MTNYHILTGDSLAGTFRRTNIDGPVIISRECFIDGPVADDNPDLFWKKRSQFVKSAFGADPSEYYATVKSEFDRIDEIGPDDEVNLWFENDLFCQTNMWFVVSLLNKRGITRVFRISPLIRTNNKWEGFGRHTSTDLLNCFEKRQGFTKGDFKLGENLWDAYRTADVVALAFFSRSLSPCFPFLEEVCRAEVERKRNARPRKVLEDLLAKGYTDFSDIFTQFTATEGIYGYGDLQVERMLKELK
ncbi:MAG TPA: DUF1835 domain-containing protein [Cyclobacteriaceae bacterium]|nr:DUF1835 domain-containing protein [Cyclobacteriaceae bacterium]